MLLSQYYKLFPSKFSYPFLLLLILVGLASSCGKFNYPAQSGTESTPFQVGKDYKLTPAYEGSGIVPKATPQQEVHVIEFFSYACEACYEIEPDLQAWLAQKPTFVKFERIPLHFFNPEWELLGRLYYMTRMLGKQHVLTPVIFKFIHEENQSFSNQKDVKRLLLENNITLADYHAVDQFQGGLDAQLARGRQLERIYQITAAPSLVIGGRYKLDPSIVGGDVRRFFEVVNHLILKIKNGEN